MLYCMKCGKETRDTHVFCDSCLDLMAQFPVRPDTHIQLPTRATAVVKKQPSRKKVLTQDEQLFRLRRSVRHLAVTLACSLLALGLTVSLLVHTVSEQKAEQDIGKNYNTISDQNIP